MQLLIIPGFQARVLALLNKLRWRQGKSYRLPNSVQFFSLFFLFMFCTAELFRTHTKRPTV